VIWRLKERGLKKRNENRGKNLGRIRKNFARKNAQKKNNFSWLNFQVCFFEWKNWQFFAWWKIQFKNLFFLKSTKIKRWEKFVSTNFPPKNFLQKLPQNSPKNPKTSKNKNSQNSHFST
jgi:hypothetical protein